MTNSRIRTCVRMHVRICPCRGERRGLRGIRQLLPRLLCFPHAQCRERRRCRRFPPRRPASFLGPFRIRRRLRILRRIVCHIRITHSSPNHRSSSSPTVARAGAPPASGSARRESCFPHRCVHYPHFSAVLFVCARRHEHRCSRTDFRGKTGDTRGRPRDNSVDKHLSYPHFYPHCVDNPAKLSTACEQFGG